MYETKTLYTGQSFSRAIYKKGKVDIWESNEGGVFEMFDKDGNTILSGAMVKSADNLSLTVSIADDVADALEGRYVINADYVDSTDDTVRLPLVEYVITYKAKKAV